MSREDITMFKWCIENQIEIKRNGTEGDIDSCQILISVPFRS